MTLPATQKTGNISHGKSDGLATRSVIVPTPNPAIQTKGKINL